MKKFYSLLTLCFAFLGIATASAQNAPEFSNEKCYTVKADRSSWVASATGFKTLSDLGLAENSTDPNQQFAFLTIEGATYLYSVGQEAYITKSGSLGAFATDPVYFTPSKDAGTFMVYFDDSHYINIGGSKQMAISSWNTGDAGNNYTFTEVGDFDPTVALASATPSAPITSLSELSNEKLYTVLQKGRGTSWAIGDNALVSSKQTSVITGKENDPKQQFAFITSNETTYLYHAAEKKFVNKDATLSATPVDPITFVNGASEGTFVVKFDDSHYVNVGGSGNMEINGWSTADDGNSNTITPVASFDPTEVLQLFAPAETTVVSIDPACGHLAEMPTSIKYTFSNEIKAVNFGILISNATGTMGGYQITPEDYTINGKEVTVNLPEQYVAGQPAIQVVLQVVDVNDKNVTYAYNPDFTSEGYIVLMYTADIKADLFAFESSDPAAGEVEVLDVINVTFNNASSNSIRQYVGGFDTTKEVVVLNAAGDVVTKATLAKTKDATWYTATVKATLETPITEAGEYTLVIPEGTVYNEMFDGYSDDFGVAYGACYNPEVRIAYTVVAPAETTVVSIDPACGHLAEMPTSIKYTFSNEIKAVNFGILISNATGTMGGYQITPEDYTINGKEVTVNLPEQYVAGQPAIQVVLQVVDVNDKNVTYAYNPDFTSEGYIVLMYTADIKADLFAFESSDPAAGEVEVLDVINVTFNNASSNSIRQYVGGFDTTKEVVVLNAAGDVVTKATLAKTKDATWYTATVKATLETPITEAGEYTLVIPEGTVYNEMFDGYSDDFGVAYGACYNPEVRIAYTVVAPAPAKTTVVSINPACGHYDELPSLINIEFSNEVKAVEFGVVRNSATGLRGYTLTENDYRVQENKVAIRIPSQYLTYQDYVNITISVIDVNDQYVTYAYDPEYESEDWITLNYTAPVKADVFVMESSDPVAGEVEKLDVINVTFSNPASQSYFQVVGGLNKNNEVVVLNATGEVVTKATMEVVLEEDWNTNVVKFTLETPVTEAGEYTFVIPEATVFDEMYNDEVEDFGIAWGARYNPEIRIAYTVVVPTGINNLVVNGKTEVYTLDGRKVNATQKLAKGVYVVNGKKVYVK